MNKDQISTTKRERELMDHALGGEKRYRNYFAAGPGSDDDKTWAGLVEKGLARLGSTPQELFPYNCYHVTKLGEAQL